MNRQQKKRLADYRELIAQNDKDRAVLEQRRQNIQAQFDALMDEINGNQPSGQIAYIRRVS